MLESLFLEVAVKKTLQLRCFPINIAIKEHLLWKTSANGCFWRHLKETLNIVLLFSKDLGVWNPFIINEIHFVMLKIILRLSNYMPLNNKWNTGAVARRCSVKKPEACNFIKKETLAEVFSCQFCEITKNNLSYRTRRVAASRNTTYTVIMSHFKPVTVFWTLLQDGQKKNSFN